MATKVEADVEYESDDGEDFNPAPAVDSDEEVASDREESPQRRPRPSKRPAPIKPAVQEDEDEDEDDGSEAPVSRSRADASLKDDEDDDEVEASKPENDGSARGDDEESDDQVQSPRVREGADKGAAATSKQTDDDDEEEREQEDEEEPDDDDDEDEEGAVTGRPRKRARRDPRNQFIDIEAEVDDEDEADEEDEEADMPGFIAEEHPDDLADLPAGAETDDRRHRELDREREREQQIDAEKEAARLKERYGRPRGVTSDAALVPKRLLLPSVDDPSIWGVRCKPGKEREVVFSITKRIEERVLSRNPLPIISAFERGGTMVGYIYVETRRQGDIIPSLDGIMNVYPRTRTVLVPIKEMPDLLRVRKTEQLERGAYVRVRRGKYQGDLAQVDEVESNGLEVTLRIVPRLDYGLNEDNNGPSANGGPLGPGDKRKRPTAFNVANRPPQRLFNEAEARKKHERYMSVLPSMSGSRQVTYLGETYMNGFLVKDYKVQHLQTENVNPTLEEVTKFTAGAEDGSENLDLSALAASLKKSGPVDSYLPGDAVEVYAGEQAGVIGRAVSVRADIVSLRISEGELTGQTIDVPMTNLRKRFREGDHVKVIGGSRFRDEVGMVVQIKDDRVTLLSDLSMQEITVFSKDLRESTDSGPSGSLGRYDIHDLVQLDPATVGCIVQLDREALRVIDQNSSLRTISPSQISNKIEKRRHAVATDRNGAEIRHDDTVREVGGDGKTGVIKHIFRAFLFLHNNEQTENAGIFVVRAANVATVAAKGGRIAQPTRGGPDLSRMNPAMQRNGMPGAQPNDAGAMPPPRSFGRDPLLGRTVTVRKGPYKGLLGIVKDSTDLEARVELHTKGKTIQIAKDVLSIKDPLTGNSIDYHSFAARGRGGGRGGFGGATPMRSNDWAGSRTPMGAMNGARTPAWGASSARTPAWSGGGGSSARAPGGGRTPAWQAEGGRTSYGGGMGAGGRTPAWQSGSRTAYGGSTTDGDAFSGSKTPAYDNSSARTPAWSAGGNSSNYGGASGFRDSNPDPWARAPQDAPTPAAVSAPTPGNHYGSAPTPAASAPTPKFSGYGAGPMDAPTPAAGAPTPYGGSAETPAAWGGADDNDDDDGPRYADVNSP